MVRGGSRRCRNSCSAVIRPHCCRSARLARSHPDRTTRTMTATTSASERLGSFVAGLRYEDIPPPAVQQACRMFLDAIGCELAAWREDKRKAGIARALAEEFGAAGGAS